MTTYILQMITFQLVFLVLYEWLLKKETFFQWNRVYLLLTPLIALVLPFIKIPALQTAIPQNILVTLPEITLSNATATNESVVAVTGNPLSIIEILIFSGIVFSILLFLWKLYKILQLKRKGRIEILKNITLVHLPKSTDAFSFAGTIFLGEQLSIHAKEQIMQHELVHIRQKHYLDLLYFEGMRIFFWFNPLLYLFQKRVATLHEFIADAETVLISNKKEYYQNLLSEVFQTQNISFINTFFNQSLIKKRIVMLQKSKSKKVRLAKFLMLVPLIAGIMLYTSCSGEVVTEKNQESSFEQKMKENFSQIDFTKLSEEEKNIFLEKAYKEYLKILNEEKFNQKNTKDILNKKESNDVPFAVIDQVPVYPGCENLATNEELKKCFSDKISQLVSENFDTSIAKNIGLTGRQRIAVQFKIDTDGNLSNMIARSPSEILVEEAERVMQLIPKMTPGIQNEKEVNVLYSLPIVFEVNK